MRFKTSGKRPRAGGWTYLELIITICIIIVLIIVVSLILSGTFGGAAGKILENDRKTMKTAVDTYNINSGEWPTADGNLPREEGEYVPIDFDASFINVRGERMSFYPHFLSELPRHHDEGVWLLDYAAIVKVAIDPEEY